MTINGSAAAVPGAGHIFVRVGEGSHFFAA